MSQSSGRRPRFDVQQEIKELILANGLAPGALLPTETELMATLGVSRSSIREALKGLQARNMVSIEHGRGTFVGRSSMDSFVDTLVFHREVAAPHSSDPPSDLDTAAELVDIRDILETALVQRVARAADDTQLGALEATVAEMEQAAQAGRTFDAEDRRFHEQLYAPLGNQLVIQLVAAFWDVLDAVRPMLAHGDPDVLTDAALHRRILDRIRDRDPVGAADAMREHFLGTHRWIDRPASGGSE